MEVTELIRTLIVVRSDVFVVNFTGYSIKFLPSVSHTRIGSSLCGLMLTTMCEYATVNPTGILLRATKQIV